MVISKEEFLTRTKNNSEGATAKRVVDHLKDNSDKAFNGNDLSFDLRINITAIGIALRHLMRDNIITCRLMGKSKFYMLKEKEEKE